MHRWRAQDEYETRQRFRSLYVENYARLVGYAMRRVATPEDAADAVAETFLIAWRRLDRVPVGDDARLWLYGTARRVLANQRRAIGRRSDLVERLAAELAAVAANSVSEQRGGDWVLAARVLARLSKEDRDLLGLVAWEGLTTAELAVVLGCSNNAAKIRVHRARRRFARTLADEGSECKDASAGHEAHEHTPIPAGTKETR